MSQQQTTTGIACTNALMQRLMELFLTSDVLPGDTPVPLTEERFERLLPRRQAEGYGK